MRKEYITNSGDKVYMEVPTTRCKMYVSYKTQRQDGDDTVYDIQMQAVTSGSEENKEFFKWTPSGQLLLSTVNETVANQLELYKEYYVDITKVE